MKQIDLNADLGEGCGDDQAIIPLLSSANISCGAHAGSDTDIQAALQACKQHGVVVGAHPSYPDRAQFGRQVLSMSAAELRQSLMDQLAGFLAMAAEVGVVVQYVKPHGALYNQAATDPDLAALLVDVIQAQPVPLAILTLPDSCLFHAATAAGLAVYREAFADRAYQDNGQLVPRGQAGALLTHQAALNQSLQLVQTGAVTSVTQQAVQIHAESLCLHGDSPEALQLAQDLRQLLLSGDINIQSFCRSSA